MSDSSIGTPFDPCIDGPPVAPGGRRTQSVHVVLPRGPGAAGFGRQRLKEFLSARGWVAGDRPRAAVEDALLITSELIANALQHGHGPVSLTLCANNDVLRVDVEDRGHGRRPGAPPPRPERNKVGAWGLALVDELADRWGVQISNSTRVWFEKSIS